MAEAELSRSLAAPVRRRSARRLQWATALAAWALWEAVAASGLLYHGVVPSLAAIAAALAWLIVEQHFWLNLAVTGAEIGAAIVIGAAAGLLVGIVLGGNRSIGAAFEPYLTALAPTPKIVILPILYLLVGVGLPSTIAIGAFACFVPLAISTLSGMRQIDPVLVRVGRSFDLSWSQMAGKIFLPALVEPVRAGLRLGLSSAIGVCLIAEIKFSRQGLGAMMIDSYNRSRFAEVYAVLIVIVATAIAGNRLVNRVGRQRRR
jgi:ABC-type nitrate/sulfonate/bicarbonate transport system permease component